MMERRLKFAPSGCPARIVSLCPPLPPGPSAHPSEGGPGAAPGGPGGGRHDGIRTGVVRSVLLAGPPADCGRAGVPLLDGAVRAGVMRSSVAGASKTDLRCAAVLGLPPREGEGEPPACHRCSMSSSSPSSSSMSIEASEVRSTSLMDVLCGMWSSEPLPPPKPALLAAAWAQALTTLVIEPPRRICGTTCAAVGVGSWGVGVQGGLGEGHSLLSTDN